MTFAPASGLDVSALVVGTSGPCPAGDFVTVRVLGAGFPEDGLNVVAVSAVAIYPTTSSGGLELAFGNTMKAFASKQNPPAVLAGRYEVVATCRRKLAPQSLGSFRGTFWFTTPTTYQTTDPAASDNTPASSPSSLPSASSTSAAPQAPAVTAPSAAARSAPERASASPGATPASASESASVSPRGPLATAARPIQPTNPGTAVDSATSMSGLAPVPQSSGSPAVPLATEPASAEGSSRMFLLLGVLAIGALGAFLASRRSKSGRNESFIRR